MAMIATRIAHVVYDAARRHFEAVVDFFAPGIAIPLRVAVTLPAHQGIAHPTLVHGLVREAQRQIVR